MLSKILPAVRSLKPADNLSRADIDTVTASDARVIIHDCQIVDDLDGVGRTFALTLHTTDTAEIANFHDLAALILVRTSRFDTLGSRQKLDYALRTGVCTGAAANALGTVDLSDSVYDVNGVEFTDARTVAEADARKGACLIALAAEKHGSAAILRPGVIESHFGMSLTPGTGYESDPAFLFAAGNPHDFSDFGSCFSAAGNALVRRRLACGYRSRIAVTARITASAAVCACETLPDCGLLGIDFHMEYFRGDGKQSPEHSSHYSENKDGKKYRIHKLSLLLRRLSFR